MKKHNETIDLFRNPKNKHHWQFLERDIKEIYPSTAEPMDDKADFLDQKKIKNKHKLHKNH